MADRLAQADAFHFFGFIFIVAFIFLVFKAFDPVSKALWSFIGSFIQKCVNSGDNSVAPAPEPTDDVKSKEDGYLGLGRQSDPKDEERKRALASLTLFGIPEFDIAVRSKLLVGPATYRMEVRTVFTRSG